MLRLSFTGQDNNVMKYEFYLPLEKNLFKSFKLIYYPFHSTGIIVDADADRGTYNLLMIDLQSNEFMELPQDFKDPGAEKDMKHNGGGPIFREVSLERNERRQSFKIIFEAEYPW
jgi:hypothetical protein